MLVHARGTCIFIYMRCGYCVHGRLSAASPLLYALIILRVVSIQLRECEIGLVRCCCAPATRCPKSISFVINTWNEYFWVLSISLRYCPIIWCWIIRKHSPNHELRINGHFRFEDFFSFFESHSTNTKAHTIKMFLSLILWHEWELLSRVFPLQNLQLTTPTRRFVLWATGFRAEYSLMAMSPFGKWEGALLFNLVLCILSIQSISENTEPN